MFLEIGGRLPGQPMSGVAMLLGGDRLWAAVGNLVYRRIGEERYNLWIRAVRPVRIDGDAVVLGYSSGYIKDKFETTIGAHVLAAVREATNRNTEVIFAVDPVLFDGSAEAETDHDGMTFADFLVGENNRAAHRAARRFVENGSKGSNVLTIHGASGLGKTHLLRSIRREIDSALYLSGEHLHRQYLEAVRNSRLESFRQKWRRASVLLVDDLHLVTHRPALCDEIADLLGESIRDNRRVAVVCDRPPEKANGFGPKVAHRLMSGVVAGLKRPDESLRLTFLRSRARERVRDEALAILAAGIDTNHKDLLHCLGQLEGEGSDGSESAFAIIDRFRRRWGMGITMDDIARVTAAEFGVRIADLATAGGGKPVSAARHICFHLSRSLLRAPLAKIGEHFGGLSHAAVLQGVRNVKQARDRDTTRIVKRIEKTLADLCP